MNLVLLVFVVGVIIPIGANSDTPFKKIHFFSRNEVKNETAISNFTKIAWIYYPFPLCQ